MIELKTFNFFSIIVFSDEDESDPSRSRKMYLILLPTYLISSIFLNVSDYQIL